MTQALHQILRCQLVFADAPSPILPGYLNVGTCGAIYDIFQYVLTNAPVLLKPLVSIYVFGYQSIVMYFILPVGT